MQLQSGQSDAEPEPEPGALAAGDSAGADRAAGRASLVPPAASSSARERILAALCLLLLVACGSWLRTSLALRDPGFDLSRPTTLFKSDPGLLYYLTERVDQAGGFLPDDFGADPRLAHPERVDIPRSYTVGQEFLCAWAHRLLAPRTPLPVVCFWVASVTASCGVIGVFLLGLALTGRLASGLLAAGLFATTPAAYRTIGFLCIREDLSLPLFALHLGCLALALRTRSRRLALGAGLAGAAAWSGWLAIGFVLGLEFVLLGVALLARAREAFDARASLALCLPIWVATLLVPALRARGLWLSLATVAALALVLANGQLARESAPKSAALAGGGEWRARGRLRAAAVFLLTILLGVGLQRVAGSDELSHVLELARAKLAHLGRLPLEPGSLGFEARMLWQGPFASLDLAALLSGLGLLLPLALLSLALGWRAGAARGLWALGFLGALGLASQVARLLGLPALLASALAARLLLPSAGRSANRPVPARASSAANPDAAGADGNNAAMATPAARGGRTLTIAVLFVQAILFVVWARSLRLEWYRPLARQAELAAMVAALPERVPEGEAVLADFMSSSAILAHTGRPVVLQAKWETQAARERVEAFWQAFYNGTPDELRALCVERFDCHWLLVDRFTLGILNVSRALAGLRPGEAWRAGSPAASLLSLDEDALRSLQDFELVWRSPASLRLSNGAPSDFYRLYRVR